MTACLVAKDRAFSGGGQASGLRLVVAPRPLILAFSPQTGRRDRNGLDAARVFFPEA